MIRSLAIAILPTCALVVLAGCGTEQFPTAELTGRVTLEGKPLEGVVLQFEPRTSDTKKPLPVGFGVTDADGRYTAFRTGNKKSGLVIGVHQVRVTVPEGNTAKVNPRYGEDRAFFAEVVAGPNVVDFELTEDPSKAKLQSADTSQPTVPDDYVPPEYQKKSAQP
jgi:hypothetical protein